MLRCLFGYHGDPIRQRIRQSACRWICPRCDADLGESDYPASDVFLKRQVAAQTKHRLLKERQLRLVRRA